jgi:peptidoglycan/LPS O-acetylase OafA/YrhL
MSARYSLVALGCAALLGWSLRPGARFRSVLEGRVLRFFGRYSYGLYVLHFIALGVLLKVFKAWIATVTPNKGVGVLGAGLMAFGLSVAAAYASYHLYERRFLRLKRFFPYERETAEVGESQSGRDEFPRPA